MFPVDKDIGTLLRHFIKQLKQGDRKAMESYEIRWRDGLQSLSNFTWINPQVSAGQVGSMRWEFRLRMQVWVCMCMCECQARPWQTHTGAFSLALSYTMSLRAVISSCRAQLKESESLRVQIVSVRPRLHVCMCKSPRKAQHINTLNLLLHVGEGLFHGYYFCSLGEDLLGDEM